MRLGERRGVLAHPYRNGRKSGESEVPAFLRVWSFDVHAACSLHLSRRQRFLWIFVRNPPSWRPTISWKHAPKAVDFTFSPEKKKTPRDGGTLVFSRSPQCPGCSSEIFLEFSLGTSGRISETASAFSRFLSDCTRAFTATPWHISCSSTSGCCCSRA